MIQTKLLADGVMEIRLIGDDGQLDAIVELTRPTHHALFVAHLLDFQAEVAASEASPLPEGGRLIQFPLHRRVQQAHGAA
jgi:hypothetical protein